MRVIIVRLVEFGYKTLETRGSVRTVVRLPVKVVGFWTM